ncbi:transglutaminase family protein [Pelagicoccus sp. SDUM812003]|uniref:transglutaminase family protein n=1 Tax=Pelagicoccus sp. SDUM812003 TaxID=3041267 RepID=UPI00280F7B35|nr:transglutaminase family protein [Pelagicoccus sp. SDUM812003]MDQ8204369.1 transglutaminase family protein [Pelagicoccus sp. SDUM812003]
MRIQISHHTRYEYDRTVQFNPHLLYMRPRENPLLTVDSFSFTFSPEATIQWMRDDFDNLPASAQFFLQSDLLEIRSDCTVTTTDLPPFDFLVRDYARAFPFEYEPLHRFNLGIYLEPPDEETQSVVKRWIQENFPSQPSDTVSWIFALNQALYQNLSYKRRDEAGIQTSIQTLQQGGGSCRDYAVALIDCARTLGIAARFVSGYLHDPLVDGNASGDMHAWAEIFLPGAGWRGIDPTNGIFCQNAYVPVAHAVVAESVNPIQGSFQSRTPAFAKLRNDVRVRSR